MKDYIVFDLEWNQSSEGKENSVEHFPFEIIEIGAVRLNEAFEETGRFHYLIKPVVYPEIHYKISEVTHMDGDELLHHGKGFEEGIKEFLEWCGQDYLFCTWGSMDLTELQRNMTYYHVDIPFDKPLLYYDVQKLYSLRYSDGKCRQSLDVAVDEMGLWQDWPFHRALDDARYTALIMKHMDFQGVKEYVSVDYYRLPQNKEEELYLVFPDYAKYVSIQYESKEEAIEDKTVTDLLCCQCGRMLRKKVRWFSANQKFYFSLGICPDHGMVRGKIRMKRSEDGRIYVVKTMKPVDEDGAAFVYEKKEEARKKRVEKMKMRKLHKRERQQ